MHWENPGICALVHIPLLQEPLGHREMGGRGWRGQFVSGSPILGHLAEPGVYPVNLGAECPISREELVAGPSARVTFPEKKDRFLKRPPICGRRRQIKPREMGFKVLAVPTSPARC